MAHSNLPSCEQSQVFTGSSSSSSVSTLIKLYGYSFICHRRAQPLCSPYSIENIALFPSSIIAFDCFSLVFTSRKRRFMLHVDSNILFENRAEHFNLVQHARGAHTACSRSALDTRLVVERLGNVGLETLVNLLHIFKRRSVHASPLRLSDTASGNAMRHGRERPHGRGSQPR